MKTSNDIPILTIAVYFEVRCLSLETCSVSSLLVFLTFKLGHALNFYIMLAHVYPSLLLPPFPLVSNASNVGAPFPFE